MNSTYEALDRLPDSVENMMGRKLLQNALLEAEDVYVSGEENAGQAVGTDCNGN